CVFRLIKPGTDLVRLLTDKVERASRPVHFKVFGEITTDQFIQNCGSDFRFRILIRDPDDVASLGCGSGKAGINWGGSSYDRWRFGVGKHAIRPQSLCYLDR